MYSFFRHSYKLSITYCDSQLPKILYTYVFRCGHTFTVYYAHTLHAAPTTWPSDSHRRIVPKPQCIDPHCQT